MCGDGQSYCAGACQKEFGWCTEPRFQIAFDVDNGDVMWDPVTDNVFDANMGDGMIYFGYRKRPSCPRLCLPLKRITDVH